MSGPRHTGSDAEIPDHRPVYAGAPNRSSEVPGGLYGDTTSQCPVYEMPPEDTSVRSSIYVAEPPDKVPAGREETAETNNKKPTCQEAPGRSEDAKTAKDETSTVTPSSEGGTDEFSNPMYEAAPGQSPADVWADAEPQDKAPTDEAGGEAIAADDTELPMYEDMSGPTEEAEPDRQSTVDGDALNDDAASVPKIELKVFLKVLKPVGAVVITVMAVVMIYFSVTSSQGYKDMKTWQQTVDERFAELEDLVSRAFANKPQKRAAFLLTTGPANISDPGFRNATFTTLGATGRTGPTSLGAHYRGQDHEKLVTLQDGIQLFTVPETGDYRIEAAGAAAGKVFTISGFINGRGALIAGTFSLSKGEVLRILVGQQPPPNPGLDPAGGGGGTFTSTFAGGSFGHGATEGKTYTYKRKGSKKKSSVKVVGGGGGGLLTNGGGGNWVRCYGEPTGKCDGEGGRAFVNGGLGGRGWSGMSHGGFGGGGGGYVGGGGGGGGGYSGGGRGDVADGACGGGGGSFNLGREPEGRTGQTTGPGHKIGGMSGLEPGTSWFRVVHSAVAPHESTVWTRYKYRQVLTYISAPDSTDVKDVDLSSRARGCGRLAGVNARRNTAETRGVYVRISVDSRPHRDELWASYARAENELCDLKNRRRLVADVKNTFCVPASFGRLQKIAGDPENWRDARGNIGPGTYLATYLGYDYFKVPVFGQMSSANVKAACDAAGYVTPCPGDGNCQFSTAACVQTGLTECARYSMYEVSQVLCGSYPHHQCAAFDGVYCFMATDWASGSACGVEGSSWCTGGIYYYDRFAFCARADTDHCLSSPCVHGTCTDGVASYTCSCENGWTGNNCDQVSFSGQCYQFSSTALSHQDSALACSANGGRLVDVRDQEQQGFLAESIAASSSVSHWLAMKTAPTEILNSDGTPVSGQLEWSSSEPAEPCDLCVLLDSSDNYLAKTAPCTEQHNYVCQDVQVSCEPNVCQNGGNCTSCFNGSATFCRCPDGFEGDFCEINIDECASNPCQNNGTCQDGFNSYSCSCPTGFHGDHCEFDTDWCAHPEVQCPFGWSCRDDISSFECYDPNPIVRRSAYSCSSASCPVGMYCREKGAASFSCSAE
ncbi:calcium ion binding [Branchiostoma belcheri]|nr:calcium ion binding [Branchiostoma belcheri]